MTLAAKDLKEMLYWIVMGRRLEERITVLFKEGRMRGHHHPGIGQEATNVGVCYGLGKEDYVLLTHRGKAPALMRGISLRDLMAGYYAKKEGLGGGRSPTGSHMYGDMSKHVIPMPGVIDADIYRSDDERKTGQGKDPVVRFKNELVSEKLITEEEYAGIEARVAAEIEDAVQYSEKQCADPDPADILRGVYSSG
jgi:TPP-dependent pyruvate/acetoin dehydrogenase alpha subunit